MSDSPFAPFEPSPPTQPQQPAAEPARRGRKRKVEITEQAGSPAESQASAPVKRRKANPEKSSLKLDISTAFEIAALLNPDDREPFEKMVGILTDAGKPGRERMLAALAKIFE